VDFQRAAARLCGGEISRNFVVLVQLLIIPGGCLEELCNVIGIPFFVVCVLKQSGTPLKEVTVIKPLILFGLALMPTAALAQSADLEATCKIVAKNFFLSESLAIGAVQSFPELKPPGVRMAYSTRQGTSPVEMTDTFECEFDKPDKPHNLARFCVSTICYAPNDSDADRKRRFDEMRILLQRAEK
jgi:hypothetical protein